MTVCIATKAQDTIINVSDQMIGAGAMTADLSQVLKEARVHHRWNAMFSANDITPVTPILDEVRLRAMAVGAQIGLADISRIFTSVYQEVRARWAEDLILSQFSLDMPAFVAALSGDPNNEIVEMKRKIQDLAFDPVFLVSGFDARNKAHIFAVSPPGIAEPYDVVGFWAIGSGASSAISNLLYREYTSHSDPRTALYHTLEAKFMAESSVGVGRKTVALITKDDDTYQLLSHSLIDPFRKIWVNEGTAPTPKDLDTRRETELKLAPLLPIP